jgi:hypothetical protein
MGTECLGQRSPTGGPQLDLLRSPPSHTFGSIGESLNICLISWWNVKFKHIGLNAVVFSRFVTDSVFFWGGAILPGRSSERNTGSGPWWYSVSWIWPSRCIKLATAGLDPSILDLSTGWRWVISFTPGRFTLVPIVGGWVGPRTGLLYVQGGKIFPRATRYTGSQIGNKINKYCELYGGKHSSNLVYFYCRIFKALLVAAYSPNHHFRIP